MKHQPVIAHLYYANEKKRCVQSACALQKQLKNMRNQKTDRTSLVCMQEPAHLWRCRITGRLWHETEFQCRAHPQTPEPETSSSGWLVIIPSATYSHSSRHLDSPRSERTTDKSNKLSWAGNELAL